MPASPLPPITVAETVKHPAFPTAVWNLEPAKKGLLPVAEGRGGPFNLSWEVHGTGPVKMLVSPAGSDFLSKRECLS